MVWNQGELPAVARELDLYDVSFLMSSWGGSLTLEQALARVRVSFLSYKRWTRDPARWLPENAVTSWAEQIIYAVDTCQVPALH